MKFTTQPIDDRPLVVKRDTAGGRATLCLEGSPVVRIDGNGRICVNTFLLKEPYSNKYATVLVDTLGYNLSESWLPVCLPEKS